MSKPAIFLDRDGVIIENRAGYVRTWDDVDVFPQALVGLARLRSTPYQVVVVSNQAGIGKGLIAPQTADEINRRLMECVAAAGGRLDGVYICPHHPDDGCKCRKPRPGLLLQAADDLQIDLGRSILIGDALTDLQAGLAAGVRRLCLVRTGRGAHQEALLTPDLGAVQVFDTLEQALREIAN